MAGLNTAIVNIVSGTYYTTQKEVTIIRQRLSHQLFSIGLIFILAGCNSLSASTPSATPIPPTATQIPPTSTPLPPTIDPNEEYEEVDPKELNFGIEGSLKYFEMGSNGKVVAIDGTITELTLDGKPIALETNEFALDDEGAFILTEDVGKIKVTFNSLGNIILWLKPSQTARLKAMLK